MLLPVVVIALDTLTPQNRMVGKPPQPSIDRGELSVIQIHAREKD
jgi:hypothetical protein